MKKIFSLVLTGSIILYLGCKGKIEPHYKYPEEIPSPILITVNNAIKPLFTRAQSVGCIVGVIKDDSSYILGYGKTHKIFGSCPNNRTLFEMGSITKTFTCMLLARMVNNGIVNLNDPLQLFVPPQISVPSLNGQEITLAHLATHTSGLPELPDEIKTFPSYCPLNPWRNYQSTHLYSFLSSYNLCSVPGETYNYSTFGIALLAHALVNKAGLDLETLLKAEITGPLNMEDTCITIPTSQKQRMAQGYCSLIDIGNIPIFSLPAPPIEFGALAGSGDLKTTIEDMLRYMNAVMSDKDTQIQRDMKLCTRNLFKISENDYVGLGWHVHITPDNQDQMIWHNGQTFGFSSFAGFLPEDQIAVVILNNTDIPVDLEGIQILEQLSGKQIL